MERRLNHPGRVIKGVNEMNIYSSGNFRYVRVEVYQKMRLYKYNVWNPIVSSNFSLLTSSLYPFRTQTYRYFYTFFFFISLRVVFQTVRAYRPFYDSHPIVYTITGRQTHPQCSVNILRRHSPPVYAYILYVYLSYSR